MRFASRKKLIQSQYKSTKFLVLQLSFGKNHRINNGLLRHAQMVIKDCFVKGWQPLPLTDHPVTGAIFAGINRNLRCRRMQPPVSSQYQLSKNNIEFQNFYSKRIKSRTQRGEIIYYDLLKYHCKRLQEFYFFVVWAWYIPQAKSMQLFCRVFHISPHSPFTADFVNK